MFLAYLNLLRVHQWIKNLFVLLPVFFAGRFFDIPSLTRAALGCAAFCFVSSAVYILNDSLDLPYDRLHPEKSKRPLAAGLVSKSAALALLAALGSAGLLLAWALSMAFLGILALYLFLNLCYSLKLKRIPVIDVAIISIGFVLRVESGGVLGQVPISQWIVIMTFLLALFLALAKRRDDLWILETQGEKMRSSLDGYNLDFVNTAMSAMAAVVIVAYIMYSVSPEVESRFANRHVYVTAFFVILGLLRYFQLTMVYHKSGSPTRVLLTDKMLPLIVGGWIGSFFAIIYGR